MPERRKPERPSTSTKPHYPNNRMSMYATSYSAPLETPKPRARHTRSNSDSSVMEYPPIRSSERREERRGSDTRKSSSRRHEEREKEYRHSEKTSSSGSRHHHSSTSKDKKPSSSRRKKGAPLDTIDRLDVTGFFGPGNFHHDGPFDACTPHRNKHTKKAPVAAFPIDGPNNSVSGVDPNRDRYANENVVMGRNDGEAFQDFSVGKPTRPLGRSQEAPSTFDATLKVNPVHGSSSAGLGSTTFLDGAPAPRPTYDAYQAQQQGLGRKKSLAQRLRGGNGPGPAVTRRTSEPRSSTSPGHSPVYGDRSSSIGIPATKVASPEVVSWASGERSPVEDATPPKSNGLLRRVKSLKVGSSRRAT